VSHEVPTSQGPARLREHPAARPLSRLVLGHGAGGTLDTVSPDLEALARDLPAGGTSVVLVDQPWRVAGRRIAPPPPRLDAAWREVLATLPTDLPLVVGGRSAGARVACRTAAGTEAVAVVALAFPLHLPGRPERTRVDELLGSGVPTLVVQGETDPFGRPDEFPPAPHLTVVPVPGDHALRKGPAVVVAAVADFLVRLAQTTPPAG
jgi:predicted alpha/beta-hydrolase family hydrolase